MLFVPIKQKLKLTVDWRPSSAAKIHRAMHVRRHRGHCTGRSNWPQVETLGKQPHFSLPRASSPPAPSPVCACAGTHCAPTTSAHDTVPFRHHFSPILDFFSLRESLPVFLTRMQARMHARASERAKRANELAERTEPSGPVTIQPANTRAQHTNQPASPPAYPPAHHWQPASQQHERSDLS